MHCKQLEKAAAAEVPRPPARLRAIKHCAYHDHIDTYSIRAFLRIIMSIILRTSFFMR